MNESQRKIVEGLTSVVNGLLDESKATSEFCKGSNLGVVSELLKESKKFIDLGRSNYYRVFFPKEELQKLEMRYRAVNNSLRNKLDLE